MSEPTTFPEEHVSEPLAYRRVSGFALASLIVSGLFAAIVLIDGGRALYDHAPLLLPLLVQLLPFVGAALAVIALLLINRSEGTLAGRVLAVCGLWLSILFGLGYLAYYTATYFAIRDQADTYTRTFLDKLKQGKVVIAFLDTMDPVTRGHQVNSEDENEIMLRFNRVMQAGGPQKRGAVDLFRASPLVHMVDQGGNDTVIEPLGIKSWDYKNRAYEVHRVYRLKTPEGVFDILIAVTGRESTSGEYTGRRWQVDYPQANVVHTEMSELAMNVQKLRNQATNFVRKWGEKLTIGDLEGTYLDMQDPAERPQLQAQYAQRQVAGFAGRLSSAGLGSNFLGLIWLPQDDGPLERELYLPGFKAAFPEGRAVRTEKLQAETPEFVASTLRALRAALGGPLDPRLARRPDSQVTVEQQGAPEKYVIKDGRISFSFEIHLGLRVLPINYLCVGRMVVKSEAGALESSQPVKWQIADLELLVAEDFDKMMMLPARSNTGQ